MFFTANNGFNFLKDLDKQKRIQLILAAIEELKNNKNFKFNALMIADLDETSFQNAKILKNYNYESFPVDPCMTFEIKNNWQNFDDYKNALKSKYRTRTNKIIEVSKPITKFEITKSNIEKYNSQIYKYYLNVVDNADFKIAKVGEKYFKALLNNDSEDFKIMGYKNEDGLQGFISFANNKTELIIHFIGLNYALNKQFKLYNRILLDCIEYAILNKYEAVNFGRTATEIKSTIGATPKKMFCYVKHFNPIINSVLVRSVNYILKPKSFQLRNPYK